MKIGVLTLRNNYNYGCVWQAYALQRVLSLMGHDVYLIDKESITLDVEFKLNPFLAPFVYIKRAYRKYIKGERIYVFYVKRVNAERALILRQFSAFVDEHIQLYKCKDYASLSGAGFDALVVGSDQIWRKLYNDNIEEGFLSFAKDWKVRRVSYAASFGVETMDEYSEAELASCEKLLHRFDAVSVREDSGVKICKDFFGVEACHLLDPTMLLLQEDYLELAKDIPYTEKGVFAYILDKKTEKMDIIKKIQRGLDLPCFVISNYVYGTEGKDNRMSIQHLDWLACFRDAEFVVTDSFHGVVFSIIFNKPFVLIPNQDRGLVRFNSIFRLLGLEDRVVNSVQDITPTHLKGLDYEMVNKKLEQMCEISKAFLREYL